VDTVIRTQLMTVSGVLTGEECERMIRALEEIRTEDGELVRFSTTSPVPKRGEAFRYNHRISIFDPAFVHALWSQTGLNTLCEAWLREQQHPGAAHRPTPARCWGLNPNLRFYRYRPGHKFEKHFDQSVLISKSDLLLPSQIGQSEIPEKLWTEYTLLIYLTGGSKEGSKKSKKDEDHRAIDYGGSLGSLLSEADRQPLQGGETVFYNTPIRGQKRLAQEHSVAASVSPVAGLALIHRHGSQCLLHEAREVISGAKYVLRSDLVFG
jgi:hypothetical protein